MVLQVGDKVLVYGAGTPWAYSKKIEPVQVGDTVDVVTLSDGTKLSMPRISLNTDDYVWVIPTWDLPFNIGDIPFSWETIPLGAAVFTLTDIIDCFTVGDDAREWSESLAGCYLIVVSGALKGVQFKILYNDETTYGLTLVDIGVGYENWTVTGTPRTGSITLGATATLSGSDLRNAQITCNSSVVLSPYLYVKIPWRYFSTVNRNNLVLYHGAQTSLGWQSNLNTSIVTKMIDGVNYKTNPKYPAFDQLDVYFASIWDPDPYNGSPYTPAFRIPNSDYYAASITLLEIGEFQYITGACITHDLAAGDKYIVYDPVTKKIKFNDSSKTILSAASWREINYPGEIVTTTVVEYFWDGQGTVYLSQSKTTNSTIYYDNELRVEVFGDTGNLRAIDYHTNDEFTYSGETVSRELVNITSILRAGKNYVQLKARDTTGTKVGFPTPIYIIRSMS